MTEHDDKWDDELLVAYLDGELADKLADIISQRLAIDDLLRCKVDDLRASWNMLDELPAVEPNVQLAQSTIELVAFNEERSTWLQILKMLKPYRWLLLASGCLISIGLGWYSSRHEGRQMIRAIADDLPVLTRFQDLDSIDSPEWLAKLVSLDHLSEVGLPMFVEVSFPDLPSGRRQFMAWKQNLDAKQKLLLQRAYKEFQSSSPTRQEQLRDLAVKMSSPDTAQAQAIQAYAGLLSKISTTEAVLIKSESNLDRRAELLRSVIRRELAIHYADRLSDLEKSKVIQWCDELKESNPYFINAEDPDGEIVALIDVEVPDPNIPLEEIQRLKQCIDTKHREPLDGLDASLQNKILKLWVLNALPHTTHHRQYTTTELLDRYHRRPAQVQDELIYQHSDQVIRQLSTAPPDAP